MKDALYWFAFNAMFSSAVWFGYWGGVDGARYVAQFVVFGLMLPICPLLLTDQFIAQAMKQPPRPVRRVVNRCISTLALATFVWHGALFTAVAFSASWLLSIVAYRVARGRISNGAAS